MRSYIQKIYVGTTDVKPEMPAKFSDDDWFGFDNTVVEHLKCIKGASTRKLAGLPCA